MKISKLLVLSALWLCGLGAQAAIVDGVRQAPEPSTIPFQVGTKEAPYYLYNTSAHLFFTQGNNWGTRGCVGPHASAVKLYFEEAADGGYLLYDFICIRSTTYNWHNACAEAAGSSVYCDQSASWGRPYWVVEPTTGNGFRLANLAPIEEAADGSTLYMGRCDTIPQSFGNAYAGFTDDSKRFPVSDNLVANSEVNHIDWALVSVEDYEAAGQAFAIFDKAQELLDIINVAKGKGINVAAQEQVYLNESATMEELEAAIAAVKEAIAQAAENAASVGSPVNMTTSLKNPDFGTGNSDGWSGTGPGMSGDGNHAAANVAEHYNKTFDTYQKLTDLPKGVYKMNAKTFFRGTYADLISGANKVAYMYAATGDTLRTYFNNAYAPLNTESLVDKYGATTYFNTPNAEGSTTTADGITYYIPNNPSTFRLYYEEEGKNWYDTNLFFSVADGNAVLGVKKDHNVAGSSTDWAVFDQFNLTYYGNAAEAYQYWVDEYVKGCTDYSTLSDDVTVTESYVEAYNETLQGLKASNREEALAAIAAVEAAVSNVTLNINLWNQYKALVNQAMDIKSNENLDQDRIENTYGVGDWAEFDAEDVINDHELTNEELQAEIDKWTTILNEVKNWYKAVDGDRVDMTNLLTNPAFTGNADGWTRVAAGGGNVAYGNNGYEGWNNASFDIYQVVKDAPEGIYEIEVQGFYRYGRGQAAWDHYASQDADVVKPNGAPVFVYMNAKQTPFKNLFDEPGEAEAYSTQNTQITTADGTTLNFPDGMASFEVASNAGKYKQSAYGIIRKGQDMRVGVKGTTNQLGDSWAIWDNFKLYNVGKNKNAVLNVLPDEIANAKTMLSDNMGKTIYNNLVAAINAAEAALTSDDGEVLFDALSDLFDAEENVSASVALFKQLNDANEALLDDLGQYSQTATQAAQANAGALYETISGAIAGRELEDADVADYMIKIKEAKTMLRLPSDYADASDLAPVEVSNVVVNGSYDADNSGWDGTTAAYNATAGNVEIFNANFDYYQDIYGLPAGTYQLNVQGFYRAGGYAADYSNYQSNPDSLNYAFYYAMVVADADSIYSSKPLKRLAAEARDDNPGDGFVEVVEGAGKFVPNSMVAAGDAFLSQLDPSDSESPFYYTNAPLTFKVGKDGKARIGMKKDVNISDNWCIWDNWTLVYFGENSELVVDGDASDSQGIENVNLGEPVRTEFFTLDGRKAAGLGNGIVIMRQTMGNGAVIIKKIRK